MTWDRRPSSERPIGYELLPMGSLRFRQSPPGGPAEAAPHRKSLQWLDSMSQGVLPAGNGGMRSRSVIASPAS